MCEMTRLTRTAPRSPTNAPAVWARVEYIQVGSCLAAISASARITPTGRAGFRISLSIFLSGVALATNTVPSQKSSMSKSKDRLAGEMVISIAAGVRLFLAQGGASLTSLQLVLRCQALQILSV